MKSFVLVITFVVGSTTTFEVLSKNAVEQTKATNYKDVIERIYKQLNISGFNIGADESSMIATKGGAPTYGEITYESLQTILDDLKPTKNDVFYDLGCGVGKTCVQVALATPAKAIGIELSPTRVNHAKRVQQELVKTKQIANPYRLQFHERNIFDEPMADATVIFLCSTCFSPDLMQNITNTIAKLPQKNIRVISLKQLPPHKDFTLETTYHLAMTWSTYTPVHLYRLKKQPLLALNKK